MDIARDKQATNVVLICFCGITIVVSSLDAVIHRNSHSFILCHAILSTVNREYR